ncbi:MAG TPA: FHA domain-containing protein [Ktedonobacterales bacterium]
MVLEFGALAPLTVAAAALSRGVLVAAAGVVVVLAILLVFVMVLRGGGSSRQKSSGLDYDAEQGPLGQPQSPSRQSAQQAPWAAPQANDNFDARDQNFGQMHPGAQQQAPGWGSPFADQPPAGNGGPGQWGAPPAPAGRWNDQMPPAENPMSAPSANDWGAPPSQGRPAAGMNPWDAPAGGTNPWDAPAAAPQQANQWGAPQPAQPSPWDAPAAAPQQQANQWGAPPPAAPSQPAWSAQNPMPSQPAWGAPQQAAPSQPAWGAQNPMPSQPAAPSQPAWGAQPAAQPAWGAQPAGMPRLVERKPDGAGREFDLRKDRLTIGRHRESDVFLEDLAVSRLHTTVSHDPSGRFILRDENSANGTYVNGQRVSEHLLQEGDEVQVGQSVLVFTQR